MSTLTSRPELTSIPSTRTRPSIVTSTRWVLLGTVVSKPLQLATTLMLARVLGPAGFGTLNLANATAVTLSGAAGMGLGDAASKFVAEHSRRDGKTAAEIASLIIWFSVLSGALCFGTAWFSRDFWAARVFHGASTDALIGLCLALALGNLLFSLSINLFTGLQLFRQLTLLSVLQASLTFALTAALGVWIGVRGALAASVLSSLVCVAWAVNRLCRTHPQMLVWPARSAAGHAGRIFSFSFPPWIGVFLLNPIIVFTFSYLALQPGGREQLGAFNTANGLKMLVAMLPGLIGSAVGPAIMEEAGRHGNRESYEALVDNALSALAFLTVPATILLILLSDILFLVYGRAYAGSHALFMPMAAGVAITVLSTPMQFALVARNRTWSLLGITAVKAALLLCLALVWIPGSLAAGLAWAWLIAELGFAVLVTEFSTRNGMTSRRASHVFYRYAATMLLVLGSAMLLPALWRWVLALPLAAVATLLIIRLHPASAVWIVGALPNPLRAPVRRGLRLVI